MIPTFVRKLFKSISINNTNHSEVELEQPIKEVIVLVHRYNGVLFCTFYYTNPLTITSAIQSLINACPKYETYYYADIELYSDYTVINNKRYYADGIKMAYMFNTTNIGQIMASFISMCGSYVHGNDIHTNYMHILNCNTNVGPTIILDNDTDISAIRLYIDIINSKC